MWVDRLIYCDFPSCPNGIGLAPGDKRLYVPQTFEGRVWQWDIPSPGELTRIENPGGEFFVRIRFLAFFAGRAVIEFSLQNGRRPTIRTTKR
jgi:hypothetical protein